MRSQPLWTPCRLTITLTLFVTLAAPAITRAAPVNGQVFTLRQPNGSMVDVRIWGDEFYQIVESLAGYTLIRDPNTQVICYAKLSPDGQQFVSTGVAVGDADPAALGLPLHLRLSPLTETVARESARADFLARQQPKTTDLEADFAPQKSASGNVYGVVVLIDFTDEVGTIAAAEISNYCNQQGYSNYNCNGSVRDYFYDVSNGALTYTNYVAATYFRAPQLKSYYDDPAKAGASQEIKDLIAAGLQAMEDSGHDFSQHDANGDGYIDAINAFYAGVPEAGWAKGLWPHKSAMFNFTADGVSSYYYQMTNIGTQLDLSTFCHENGHMLMLWDDLYDYGYDSRGIGKFGIMCSYTSGDNPQEPCAYHKYTAGWVTAVELSSPQTGLSLAAGASTVYKYTNDSDAQEYYLIENRQQSGRDAGIPDAGLAIWHVDEGMFGTRNNYQQMTEAEHYQCTLVQADGRWDLENNLNYGDSTDLWSSPTYTDCGPSTSPDTSWWDGTDSALEISNISASGATMTFDFTNGGSSGGTAAVMTQPASDGATLTGSTYTFQWGTGTNVTQYRLWVGTTVGGNDIYSQNLGTSQTASVTGLPTNGSTVYVRLGSYIDSTWESNDYSYTAYTVSGTPAVMTTPASDGATLTGASYTFQWNAGTNVSQYRLWVGTTNGGTDIYNQSTGTTQQATVTGLPTDGSTLYVRLHSLIGESWSYNSYSYTAATVASGAAEITAPASDGATLTGASYTFQWDAGTNVEQYRLWVGTTNGGTDIYNQSTGTTQQATVTGLPTDGSTVYVRLNSYINNVWEYNSYSYTAATVASGAAEITAPASDGATLTGAGYTFQWDAGTNVSQYRLWVGTTDGGTDIYNQSTGTTQQATVTGLPTDGSTVYVRLNSYINNVWEYNSYSYTAATVASGAAEITTPASDGATLTGASYTFQWDAGSNVSQYRLWVGTTAGGRDIYNQSTGTTQQATITGLPTDGSTVYVRLNSYINNVWEYNSYSYTAATVASGAAEMTTPASDGATLTGGSSTFQWDTGTNVTQYRLWVGTTDGGRDIYNQSTGTTQQATITGLPTDGSTVYVRLNSYINNVWEYNSYSYTAATVASGAAEMTTPASDGATLTGASYTFQWDAGTNVSQYRLWVGTTDGGRDIYNESTQLLRSATITGLPTDGSAVYVRINSYINGTWHHNDYAYTAATLVPAPAEMIEPANGTTLTGVSQTFRWNAGVGCTAYRLWVGTTAGGKDIYNDYSGAAQQVTVTNLPSAGNTVSVRLNSLIGSQWQYNSYTYTAASMAPPPPPGIVSAVSRKTHGSAGDYDVNLLSPNPVESRQDGATQLVITFDTPIQGVDWLDPSDVILTASDDTAIELTGVSILDRTLYLHTAGTPDASAVRVGFPGIQSATDPGPTVASTLCLHGLDGDCDGNGITNVFDLIAVRNALADPTDTSNFTCDVNVNGQIDIFDLLIVRNHLAESITADCP